MTPQVKERPPEDPSPLTGKFFLLQGESPVVLRFDDVLCLPVFSGPQQIVDAERWFGISPGVRVRQIINGTGFYEVARRDYRIVLDPRVVEGQCRYDVIEGSGGEGSS